MSSMLLTSSLVLHLAVVARPLWWGRQCCRETTTCMSMAGFQTTEKCLLLILSTKNRSPAHWESSWKHPSMLSSVTWWLRQSDRGEKNTFKEGTHCNPWNGCHSAGWQHHTTGLESSNTSLSRKSTLGTGPYVHGIWMYPRTDLKVSMVRAS